MKLERRHDNRFHVVKGKSHQAGYDQNTFHAYMKIPYNK